MELCEYGIAPTESDLFLLSVLMCLGFSEHAMVYDVNGLLSRDILVEDGKELKEDLTFLCQLALEGQERNQVLITAEHFPGHETRSKKDSKKLINTFLDDAQNRWFNYVGTFEYDGRF